MSELQEPEVGQGKIDWRSLPCLPLAERHKIPNCRAIYFVGTENDLLYIGQAVSLTVRWRGHKKLLIELAGHSDVVISWLETDQEDIRKLEAKLIHAMRPTLNRRYENPFDNPPVPIGGQTVKTKALMVRFDHTCQHCGHRWKSLLARPVVCPRCKSYSWDEKPKGKSK